MRELSAAKNNGGKSRRKKRERKEKVWNANRSEKKEEATSK